MGTAVMTIRQRLFGAALVLGIVSGGPALAALSDALLGQVNAAVTQPTPDQVSAALRNLFLANPAQIAEIAGAGAAASPSACGAAMSEASAVAPGQAVDIAAAIVTAAPGCEEQVAGILAGVLEELEAAAGPEGGLAPTAGDAPAFPAANPITSISTTAENPSTDTTSPTTP